MTVPDLDGILPLLVVASSLVTGILIAFLREEQVRLRTFLNLLGPVVKLLLVGLMFWGVFNGHEYAWRLTVAPGLDLLLRVDFVSLLFVLLSSVLWLVTTIYAIGYLEESPNRSRFFAFFAFSVAATMGIALAGNLITFLIFYEALTLATYPLVVHRGTPESLAAGRRYLAYTLTGGAVLLVGVAWTHALAGPVEFRTGGVLDAVADDHPAALRAIFVLLVGGLGVKAALVPLHGWLPPAMVAPAPVSALLHAVAVVKAGAYGIVRVIYDIFGPELALSLGLLGPLTAVAATTIVWGSLRALMQDELKRRLAYSTVSQVSYIVLGAAIFGPLATLGALVHLVHQGLMKITLFFCAGNMAETLGVHSVRDLQGVGRRMPVTAAAFTIGAFGMIGVPPVAGFVSKWYLGVGAAEAGQAWVIGVLAISSLLNAAYFLPVVGAMWFGTPTGAWRERFHGLRLETRATLLAPPVITALLALLSGLLAASGAGPLALAARIVDDLYTPL